MVYLVVAVIILHFSVVPITVGATVNIDTDKKLGIIKVKLFFITVFKMRLDTDMITNKIKSYAEGGESNEEQSEDNKSKGGHPFLFKLIKNTAARVRVRLFDINARMGFGNAALDAVAVGAFRILYNQACAFLHYDGRRSEIYPYYDGELLFLELNSIFSLCIADIIYAFTCTCFERVSAQIRRKKYANTVTE